jgi:hypothetical protein
MAEGAEVVVALEEGEAADGDDFIGIQKQMTRRGCITAWLVFLAQYPHEAWQRGAGMVIYLFLKYIFLCTLKGRNTETNSSQVMKRESLKKALPES